MPLDEIERALKSMRDWPRVVGCMGGEPTMHPDFEQICHLYAKYFPRKQCGLWTSGGEAFEKHKDLILKTFMCLLYNDHTEVGKHQPWMISIDEVVDDVPLKNTLIDNCWVQKMWSPSINPKGAFFCEIAAVMDLLFDMGGGYPIEPSWWMKWPKDFKDQRDKYCGLCSMALPFGTILNDSKHDYVSPGMKERLKQIRSPWLNKLRVVDEKITRADIESNLKDYRPWEYLGPSGKRDDTGFVKGGYAEKRQHAIPLS
jgi:hypothetical protein